MTQNEERLELFADLIEPAAEILGDKELSALLKGGGKPVRAVRLAIKKHKSAVVEVLARLDGQDPAAYVVPGPFALAGKLLKLLNDPEVMELFTLQGQSGDAGPSGSATETTEDGAN